MNFGELLEEASGARVVAAADNIAYNMPAGAIAHPRLGPPAAAAAAVVAKSIFASSTGLSLALQTSMQEAAQVEFANAREQQQLQPRAQTTNNNSSCNNREEEYESRSGSDNMEGGSGDDQDADHPPRKKRYHRHTPQQIQELESLFKECPHPDEKQRAELSKRLCLENRQVKFWFQNRRTQMKTQLERHENAILRSENDKLRAENMAMRDAMRSPMCSSCGGPAVLGEASVEAQHLRLENARLKDELDRVCALAGKFLGRPSPHPPSAFPSLPLDSPPIMGLERSIERSMLLELALAAMDELLKLAQTDDPIWFTGLDGSHGKQTINYEEYLKVFPRCIGPKPVGYVTETSRETAMVIINSLALVETLVDANRWVEMFPCMIARASTTDVISAGMGGTRNGALQLMTAELQVLSPLVPVREVSFLRFCKQHAEGVWAVVDVSVDAVRDGPGGPVYAACRRLPSGCVVQDMPNGYSKVTWVEHAEYDEGGVHQLFRPQVAAGMAFGAQRWVATLQRQCQCLAVLMSSSLPSRDSFGMTAAGRRSMLKLALRMTDNFCAGVCGSSIHAWDKICGGSAGDDVRVMTRKSVDNPGEPPGVVLSAATSVWLPATPQRLFAFLRDERLRSEWDILSNGGPMQEMAHIAKGPDPANSVSLLRSSAMNVNQGSMLILQETCMDATGALVVYAPVDIPAMNVVMNGGDSACVALLPSGFAIVPDGHPPSAAAADPASPPRAGAGGSLLTVAFQVLVNSQPTAKLTVESVDTVSNLISCTVQKIKAALHCEN